MQRATALPRANLESGADLALAYLQLIQHHQALALRHNALIDWVNQQCRAP